MSKWSREFPKEEGCYWFYGYRYGKYDRPNGETVKPELMFMEVHRCANGFMYVASGQFMYESEVEEAHFMKVDLPKLPDLSENS